MSGNPHRPDSPDPQQPDLDRAIWTVECRLCPGLIDRVPRPETTEVGREHVHRAHPLAAARALTTATIDDLWEARPAAAVCETCYSVLELPYWVHISDPPTHIGEKLDEDGQWLLCDTCHDLRLAGRPATWVRHAWTSLTTRSPWLLQLSAERQIDSRAQLAGTIQLLLQRLDDGQRLTL